MHEFTDVPILMFILNIKNFSSIDLQIAVRTWNVNGKLPYGENLKPWIFPNPGK